RHRGGRLVMRRRDGDEVRPADLVGADHSDPRRAHCAQSCGPVAVAENRLLPEDCARANLRDDGAVDLDIEHAVEEHEELVPRLALLDEPLPAGDTATHELGALAENGGGEPALELRRGGGREGRRLKVAPRSAFFELEVERAEDGDQPTVDSVQRVAGKRARGDEPRLARAVCSDQKLHRRPGGDRADVEVGTTDDRSRYG